MRRAVFFVFEIQIFYVWKVCRRFALTNIREPIIGKDWFSFFYFLKSNLYYTGNYRYIGFVKKKSNENIDVFANFQIWNYTISCFIFQNKNYRKPQIERKVQFLQTLRNQQVTPIGCLFWKIERPKAYWPIDRLRLAGAGRGGADDLMGLRHSHCLRKTLIFTSTSTYCNRCIDISLYFFTIGR